MAPSFEDHLKNWKAYKIEKFRPTTTDIIETARQMRKFIIIIENVFQILGIEDGESQTKLFKLTDVELHSCSFMISALIFGCKPS